MARFIEESKIINQKIQENIGLALNDFSVKIGGKPTYCRYFHRNTVLTESDPVLNTVYRTVGTSSPVVYNEIENFPVYGLEQLNLDMQENEYGFEVESEHEVILLPNTISPLPDDFIAVPYLLNDKDEGMTYKLFKVSNVTPSILGSKQYWKLSISLSDKAYETFKEQTKENLIFSGEDYKEGRQSILYKESFLLLYFIRQYRFSFLMDYHSQYFDSRVNEFALIIANSDIIDYSLKIFMNETNLLNKEKNSLLPKYLNFSNMKLVDYRTLRSQFERSLYNKVLNDFDTHDETDSFMTTHELIDLRTIGDHTNNIFRHYNSAYYMVKYDEIGRHNFIKEDDIKPLLERIKENILYDDNDDLNLLIQYFNTKKFSEINFITQQKELADTIIYRIQKLLNKYSAFSYFYLPILIFFLCVIEGQVVERETV